MTEFTIILKPSGGLNDVIMRHKFRENNKNKLLDANDFSDPQTIGEFVVTLATFGPIIQDLATKNNMEMLFMCNIHGFEFSMAGYKKLKATIYIKDIVHPNYAKYIIGAIKKSNIDFMREITDVYHCSEKEDVELYSRDLARILVDDVVGRPPNCEANDLFENEDVKYYTSGRAMEEYNNSLKYMKEYGKLMDYHIRGMRDMKLIVCYKE